MYAGRIVETGSCRDVISAAAHPYTTGLLSFRSDHAAAKGVRLPAIPGAPPDMANLPAGCAFAPRCAHVRPRCTQGDPRDVAVGPHHRARCVLLAS
jgi:peptide/nickel transport system ATP-binding protein